MDFTTEKQGTTFYFDEDNPEKGSVTLALLTPADIEKIEKQCTKKRIEYKKGGRFEVRDVNDDKYLRLTYDQAIQDWDNVCIDGESVECNIENKIHLMKTSNAFAKFVSEKLEILAEELEKGSAEKK